MVGWEIQTCYRVTKNAYGIQPFLNERGCFYGPIKDPIIASRDDILSEKLNSVPDTVNKLFFP